MDADRAAVVLLAAKQLGAPDRGLHELAEARRDGPPDIA